MPRAVTVPTSGPYQTAVRAMCAAAGISHSLLAQLLPDGTGTTAISAAPSKNLQEQTPAEQKAWDVLERLKLLRNFVNDARAELLAAGGGDVGAVPEALSHEAAFW